MTTVDKHEYYKMMQAREERIRTFMQLELEACLDEVSWMLRYHNCEVLDCPQEYPARLLPTPPPSYIDNLQSRLIQARKGIFSASLKMILNAKYQLPVQRPAPETPKSDDMIGEHRAGEYSQSSECDVSPRRAAVDTGSEEPGTPQQSPAISKGPRPGASRAETPTEEEIFLFETSMDGFLRSNFTSMEQECALLHQPDVGVDDNEKETTTTSQQAAVREEFVSHTEKRQGTTQLGQPSSTSSSIGAGFCDAITFLKRIFYLYTIFACFPPCIFVCAIYFCVAHKNCRSRYERRYELFGCTGCVNCCTRRGAFIISIFHR